MSQLQGWFSDHLNISMTIKMFVISVDEIQSAISEEDFNKYINIMLLYYAAVKKDISEQDIVQKIQELDGKGSKIMTILERREQKGIEQGIEQGVQKGKIEIVKELIRAGAETGLIVKASKMSREEIEKIRKEMQA